MTATQASKKWGVSLRQVQRLLAADRIQGSRKHGRVYLIPADAEKPADPRPGRILRGESYHINYRKANIDKTSYYFPQSELSHIVAATYISAPRENPEAVLDTVEERLRVIPEIALAYLRGDFERVKRRYLEIPEDGALKLCACPIVIVAAISLGDYPFYRELETYLHGLVEANIGGSVTAYAQLALAGAYLGAGVPNMIPDWLKTGDFTALPQNAKRNAAYMRVQYFRSQKNPQLMLAVAQTTLALCANEQEFTFEETYLLILCAVACHDLKREKDAERYLLEAMRMNIPHGFISPFMELASALGTLLERCLEREFPEYSKIMTGQWKHRLLSWIKFHNQFKKDLITSVLTLQEAQMARLAAQGVPFKEIAEQFNIAVKTLDNKMRKIYEKLSVKNKKELAGFTLPFDPFR
jgi:DNA-binding CsgD family transcriptional regulator